MQLRKVCSHPFLFDWPIDPETHEEVINDELVGASGKMLVLDRLLTELFKRGHKVLLFSQFTTMLDIIEVLLSIIDFERISNDSLRRLGQPSSRVGTCAASTVVRVQWRDVMRWRAFRKAETTRTLLVYSFSALALVVWAST